MPAASTSNPPPVTETPEDRLWRMPEEKRARLLDPAEQEFVSKGYADASLNRILASAKMSKGQAYYYITGKADLYRAVCRRRFAVFSDITASATQDFASADDFWAGLQDLCANLAAPVFADANLSKLARGVYDSAEAQDALSDMLTTADRLIETLVANGQANGAIRDDVPPDFMTAILASVMRGIDKWFATNADQLSPSAFHDLNNKTFEILRGLAAPTAKTNTSSKG